MLKECRSNCRDYKICFLGKKNFVRKSHKPTFTTRYKERVVEVHCRFREVVEQMMGRNTVLKNKFVSFKSNPLHLQPATEVRVAKFIARRLRRARSTIQAEEIPH